MKPLLCPVCSTSCKPHDTFCPTCGFVFGSQPSGVAGGAQAAPDALPLPPMTSVCASCGQALPAGARFCVMCGKPTLVSYKPPQTGQTLAKGRYTVQRPLSKGGMGAIYLATDHDTFDRTVVIKAMLDYFDPSNPQEVRVARDRFLHEARTLAELRHPAIPQIYTSFQDGPHNYIVMEYIEGRDLEQQLTHPHQTTGRIIRGKPYPLDTVIPWGVALCKVLEYLTSRGSSVVVHHDIKPANLLLDSNSKEIRLVDFGTAKARLFVQPGRTSVGLQKSSIYGTQGYAPPEQYRGESEPRSDVYALAATLYHLATDDDPGNHPFDFPRLKDLGRFGSALKGALHNEVSRRPTATAFRRQLESLLSPTRPLQAPDGTEIAHEQELVAWCEQHWEKAAAWLYGSLPDLIEHLWLKPDRAEELREIVRDTRNRNVGLDTVLEKLDPHDFGKQYPLVTVDQRVVDFGLLARRGQKEHPLILTNAGRRFVRVRLDLPPWVRTRRASLALNPGRSTTLKLTADMQEAPSDQGRVHQANIVISARGGVLLDIAVKAQVAWWYPLWQAVLQARDLWK